MAGKGKLKGKARAGAVGAKRRPSTGADRSIPASATRPSNLSDRYQITPAPRNNTSQSPMENFFPPLRGPSQFLVNDYPPPFHLLQTSLTPPPQSSLRNPRCNWSPPQPQRRQSFSNPEATFSQPQINQSPLLQNSDGQSNTFPEEDDEDSDAEIDEAAIDDTAHGEADLEDSRLEALNALLSIQNRHTIRGITTLSPIEPQPEKTTWFGRDASSLTRKITRIIINKSTGPFYTWKCVPRERQERNFLEFAKTHHWDPLFSGIVQQHFEAIAAKRLKDMVSTARRTRVRPKWIKTTLWTEMCSYWDTDVALEKSRTASKARKSNRKGLGEYKHYTGQKSYAQIQQELEAKFNRPVSIGEVFLFIHTRPDGKFADLKAERIAKNYKELVQAKQSEQWSETSEGTSRELTKEEFDDLFLQGSGF